MLSAELRNWNWIVEGTLITVENISSPPCHNYGSEFLIYCDLDSKAFTAVRRYLKLTNVWLRILWKYIFAVLILLKIRSSCIVGVKKLFCYGAIKLKSKLGFLLYFIQIRFSNGFKTMNSWRMSLVLPIYQEYWFSKKR